MADGQVLHDVLESGIRWRVTLHATRELGMVVRFRKSGAGGRLLHEQLARWSPFHGAGLLTPRERVGGGMVPGYLVEHIESLLRGAPLPGRRTERERLLGRLVHCPAHVLRSAS